MLMPKRTKFRKAHRGRRRGQARRGSTLSSGEFGLQATTVGWVDSREIEAGRRSITRAIQRSGQVWLSPAGSSLNSLAWKKRWLERLLGWPPTNCQSVRVWFLGMRRSLLANTHEIRGLNDGELDARIMETKEELLRLRVQHATLQLPDTSRLGHVRREIARMLTVQRERELAAVEPGERR